jgi:hypothetical protein
VKNEAVQVAKIERDAKIVTAALTELGNLAANPVVQLVGGYVVVEALQRGDKPLLGNVSGTAVESAITLAVILGSLGKAADLVAPALTALPALKALL